MARTRPGNGGGGGGDDRDDDRDDQEESSRSEQAQATSRRRAVEQAPDPAPDAEERVDETIRSRREAERLEERLEDRAPEPAPDAGRRVDEAIRRRERRERLEDRSPDPASNARERVSATIVERRRERDGRDDRDELDVDTIPERRDVDTGSSNPTAPQSTARRVESDRETYTSQAIDAAAELERTVADLPGVGRTADVIRSGAALGAAGAGAAREAASPITEPVVEWSASARDTANEEFVDPVAGEMTERAFDVTERALGEYPGQDEQERIVEEGLESFGRGITGVVPGGFASVSESTDATVGAAQFSARQINEEGVVRGSQAIGGAAAATTAAGARQFAQDPGANTARALGFLAGGFLTSAGAGRALGRSSTLLRDRVRTAGGTKIDAERLTQPDVLERVEDGGTDFPPADEPDLFMSDPAEAVRRQAERRFPDELEEQFEQAGVTEGSQLYKALELEPDPDSPLPGANNARGFETRGGDYEVPGASVGPDLSPYFLEIEGGSRRFSARPGLPDTGNNPTTVALRTEVDESPVQSTTEFGRVMREDARGDTTAYTPPERGEFKRSPGEVEANVPPEATFVDVGDGPVRNALRRVGIGADFYTEIGGRRVPIRTVADPDDLDGGGAPRRSFLEDERAQTGGAPGTRRVRRSIDRRDLEPATDRPLPIAPSTGSPGVGLDDQLDDVLGRSRSGRRGETSRDEELPPSSSGGGSSSGRARPAPSSGGGSSSGGRSPVPFDRGGYPAPPSEGGSPGPFDRGGSPAPSSGGSPGPFDRSGSPAPSSGGEPGPFDRSGSPVGPSEGGSPGPFDRGGTPPGLPGTPGDGSGRTPRPRRRDEDSDDELLELFSVGDSEEWKTPIASAEDVFEDVFGDSSSSGGSGGSATRFSPGEPWG